MHRSIVTGVMLLIPLFLLALLLGLIPLLAVTAADTQPVAVTALSSQIDFSWAGSQGVQAADPPRAAQLRHEADPAILWGQELRPKETDAAEGQVPAWRTNRPPRPPARPVPPPEVMEQPLGVPYQIQSLELSISLPRRARESVASPQSPSTRSASLGQNSQPHLITNVWLPAADDRSESGSQSMALAAPFSVTLSTVHRGTDSNAFSSIFVFTNTGVTAGNYSVDFYWPNGEHVGSDGPYALPAAGAYVYNMDLASFGEGTFAGYAVVGGDQPLVGEIATPDYGLISGIVYESDGATPLMVNNVSVNRQSDDAGYGGIYNMSDGRFYLGGLPDDAYIVFVHAPYPWASQWYNGQTSHDQADAVTVSGAGETPIVLTLQAGGQITGTVFADDGVTPLENVNVDVAQGGYGTCTDASGRYTIEGLPYGDYKVVAGRDWNWCVGSQSEYAAEYYNEVAYEHLATAMPLSGGADTVTGIDFTLEQGGIITGTVYSGDGSQPLANINVDVVAGGHGTCTDANGRYKISGLPSGEYKAYAGGGWNWCLGSDSQYITEYYQETQDVDLAQALPISSTSLSYVDVNFTLDRGGIITGTVYADDGVTPLESVNVDVDPGGYGTCTDANGRYSITGIPYGQYRVQAGGGWNWCTGTDSEYAREYYQETMAWDEATVFTLDAGNDLVTAIDFTLSEGGRITGRVTDADTSVPLANVWVGANEYDGGGFGAGGWTDASGFYTITGLVDTDYRVSVEGDVPAGYAQQYYPGTFAHHLAGRVTISGGSTISGIDFHLEPGGRITGLVVDKDTLQPIPNLNISANLHEGEGGMGRCTEVDGSFVFDGLVYSGFTIQAGGDWNYCQDQPSQYARKYYSDTFEYDQAMVLTLGVTQTEITGIDFEMEPGGIITGRVTDDLGNPLENVNVGTSRIGSQTGEGACSDADGYYAFYGLPFGDYVVEAGSDWNGCRGEPSIYLTKFYSNTYDYDSATPVPLSPGNELQTGIDFIMEEGASISGRVTDASDGSPLTDVWVNVDFYDGGGYGRGARTDASGYYTVTGLLEQDYRVGVNPDSAPGFAQQYYPDEFAHHLAGRVTVPAGSTVGGIDFHLEPGGVITGTVVDQATGLPLANINVNSGLVHGEGGVGRCTEADGSFVLSGLIYGEYTVSAGGGWNHCQDRPSDYVEKFFDGVFLYDEATRLLVDGPAPITDINIALEPGGYIAGHVEDTSGTPVEGLRMGALLPSPDCPWCHQWVTDTDTDANGDYLLGPLPPLGYAVYACAGCSSHLLVEEFYDDVFHIQGATPITPTTGATVTDIDMVLDPGVWITGKVTVPPGYSAGDIPVDAWQTEPNGYGSGRQTDASGTYTIPVPPIYDSYWGVAAHPWETDLGAQWAHQFDLSRHTNWDFDLGLGGTITGRLTSGGAPVEGVWVNADSPWMSQGDDTDANGYYAITNLPPGEYRINVNQQPDYMETYYGGHQWDWATPIWLEEGEVRQDVNIEILPLGRIEGHVYESDGTTPLEGVRVTALNDDGFWRAWTQTDGYFTIDVPAGDHRVYFETEEFWARVPVYYGGSHTYRDAQIVAVPPYLPSEAPTSLIMTMEMPATLQGVVRDAGSGDPVGGIYVVAQSIDPVLDRRIAYRSYCTDETGEYSIPHVWPGDTEVMALGTCGGSDYGLVTDTVTASEGAVHVVNLDVTAGTAPPRPFTIRTADSQDYTPLTSGNGVYLRESDEILPALYEPLVALNDQNEWTSELLVQVPTPDNGGVGATGGQLVVTYQLKPGLLWSDGAPLTSADIHFTWQMFTQVDSSMDSYLVQVDPLWKIERIDTPDAETAVVTYKPGQFPPSYLSAITYLLPEHVLSGEHRMDVVYGSDYAHHPVGNGPYVIADYVPGSHIDLRANPNYHNRSLGMPAIEDVRFLFTYHPDYALPSGLADVALDVDPGIYASFDIPTASRGKSIFRSIVPNTDLPFFADEMVRRALYYALDRDEFISGYSPYDVKADVYLPPGHPMYSDGHDTYLHDLAMASSLLDAAGWIDSNGNGIRDKDGIEFEFDLYYPSGSIDRQGLCLMWQADLATIGVDVNVSSMDWGDLLEAGRRGELDAYTMGWGFDSLYDPMAYNLFHSRQVPTAHNSYWGGNPNNRWTDPEPAMTDAWLEAARTELDQASLQGIYADHLTRFTNQLPIWVYSHDARTDAYTPVLLNFSPGQATPAAWNIADWDLIPNPYDLAVRKKLAAGSPAPQPGETIIYEIKVHNYGALPVTEVGLVDLLPDDVVFVSATPAEDSYSGHELRWNLGELAAHSAADPVRVAVQIPNTMTHGSLLTNTVEVYGQELDSQPANNAFVHLVKVREDVDLAVTKAGVGQPAVGAEYIYYIDYANWGGAPADSVVLTDTLPLEVIYRSANPTPDDMNGQVLTWTLPTLLGNQWGGQIELTTEISDTGSVVNTAGITYPGADVDLGNNSDDHRDEVDDILAPIIIQPTQGTTDGTPTFKGQAPALSDVDLWDLSGGMRATWVASTTANLSGTWELPLVLPEGSYIIAATATKAGLTSDQSNTATIQVKHDLLLDPDFVRITSNGADISRGVIRAERRTLGHRTLDFDVVLACSSKPTAKLRVTENGLFTYDLPAVSVVDAGANNWDATFRLWLSDPHSTYDIWLGWECGETRGWLWDLLLYLLIDPDGFVYDQSLVDAGSTITDSLILDADVTAYVWRDDLGQWKVWPAEFYGQVNPQVTDGTTDDGVAVAGYYSFLTPPGQYRIEAEAPGYQPFKSQILTVINDPIHLDIGLKPVVGGVGQNLAPAVLTGSSKLVDRWQAEPGDTLTYDIRLVNSGQMDTGVLHLTDPVPAHTAYVDGSVTWSGGYAEYDADQKVITWTGTVTAGEEVHLHYHLTVNTNAGDATDIINIATIGGPAQNLASLPPLSTVTTVQVSRSHIYLPVALRNH